MFYVHILNAFGLAVLSYRPFAVLFMFMGMPFGSAAAPRTIFSFSVIFITRLSGKCRF